MSLRKQNMSVRLVNSKNTQPITTKNKEYICRIAFGQTIILLRKTTFSIKIKVPKYNPHKAKFQLAPCQSPVRNHTMNKFRISFHLPTRLPPRGIYTYSLNHDPREICHLCQNSEILCEIYGYWKFSFS